jgi:hypothetical protein
MAKENKKNTGTIVVIDPDMPDYSRDPYFVKKAEEAEAVLKKYGIPEKHPEKQSKKIQAKNGLQSERRKGPGTAVNDNPQRAGSGPLQQRKRNGLPS